MKYLEYKHKPEDSAWIVECRYHISMYFRTRLTSKAADDGAMPLKNSVIMEHHHLHRPLYVNCTQDTIYCQRMRHRHLPCGLSASVTLSARDIPQTAVLIINLPLPRPGSLAYNKQRRKFLFRSTATTALNSAILKLMCRGETISGRHVFASYF